MAGLRPREPKAHASAPLWPPIEPATVLFDAECELCRRVRAFGDGKGAPGLLRFVPAQGDEGQRLLATHGLAGRERDTLVTLVGSRAYTESAAVVQVARRLRFPYNAQAALWLVPRPLRDVGYRFVAKRRHRLRRAG